MGKLDWYRLAFHNLGVLQTIRNSLVQRTGGRSAPKSLMSKCLRHPVWCRPGTSDHEVFKEVFVEREYGCFDDLGDVGLIIDLGANVGYTAAYFLSRFSNAFVVAVEPDAENFALLSRNLEPYRDRCLAVRAAVWPEKTKLYFDPGSLRQDNEWGRTVTSSVQAGEEIEAVDVPGLIAMTCYDAISILKIDIEGSEGALFSRNYEQWLAKTENFCIELHGADNRAILEQAITGTDFVLSQSGELTIGTRRTGS